MDANVTVLDGVNQALKEKYKAILSGLFEELSSPNELSEIFLTSVASGYEDAKRKIMIVGSEPGGGKDWHWGYKGWEIASFKRAEGETLEFYVVKAMAYQKQIMAKVLNEPKNKQGASFHNFMRRVMKISGDGSAGIIYSNLFCFSDNNGSTPYEAKDYKYIKTLSHRLLTAQLTILKPHIVIFANGKSSAHVLRSFLDLRSADIVSVDDWFASIEHPDFPNSAFYATTYHPSYKIFSNKIQQQTLYMIFDRNR